MNIKNTKINPKIVQELLKIYPTIDKTFEEVCQDILTKKNLDYCGAYELLNHDELKKKCFLPRKNKQKAIGPQDKEEKPKSNNAKVGKLRSVNRII